MGKNKKVKEQTTAETQQATSFLDVVRNADPVAWRELNANKRAGSCALYIAACENLELDPLAQYQEAAAIIASKVAAHVGTGTLNARKVETPNEECKGEVKPTGIMGYFNGFVKLAFAENRTPKGHDAHKLLGGELRPKVDAVLPKAREAVQTFGVVYGARKVEAIA